MSRPSRKARVLIVDDDAGLLKLIGLRLNAGGYAVETAENAEQALAKVPQFNPHVVVTDLSMPGMSGLELLAALHERDATLPVILLTAHGTIPDAVAATRKGAFAFLTKPFESRQLLDQVAEALRSQGIEAGGLAESGAASEDTEWAKAIITRSPKMRDLLRQARRIATGNANVLIQSESGTGKELLARALHEASPRRKAPFLAINCSAIPEQLLESELFGHLKGAFTGATQNKKGLFEAAQGGTLFLDEVGDMPLPFQAKLLRVLQEREVRPLGATQSTPVDVRIISATHKDLEKAVEEGEFREDLYYRLNVIRLELPLLAERREDIPLLANHFLKQLASSHPEGEKRLSPEALSLLGTVDWPGNIRQLRNVIEQVYALSPSAVIPEDLVQRALRNRVGTLMSFDDARDAFERDYLVRVLQITEGNVSQAARLAGRNRTDFYKLLQRHGLEAELFRPAAGG